VNEYQIACWFESEADCVDVQIHLNQEGRASGDATAYFTSEDIARAAMKRNKEDMEGRYINLSMDSVTATFNNSTNHNSEYCVKMSGVPFRATEQELKDFFKGVDEPIRVKVILNRDGRPSGDALAEFDSEEAVENALSKDRECMGSRYVVVTREGKKT
jgi:heterogeneous nuclear ribonucleoprotein F/H